MANPALGQFGLVLGKAQGTQEECVKNAQRKKLRIRQYGRVKEMAETFRRQRYGRKVDREVNGHQFARLAAELMIDPDMRARMIGNRQIREAIMITSGPTIDFAHLSTNNKRRIFLAS